eukprot:13085735-Ditylum_brightwellii.AAC.1
MAPSITYARSCVMWLPQLLKQRWGRYSLMHALGSNSGLRSQKWDINSPLRPSVLTILQQMEL